MIAGMIALVVICVTAFFIDRQNRQVDAEQLRARIQAQAGAMASALEQVIYGNIQLVNGLVALIEAEPDLDQAKLDQLGASLLDGDSPIVVLGLAPDMRVSMIYPFAPNRSVIGLDYTKNASQREPVLKARDTGRLVFAGPVDLVQGGRGFVGRFPVFVDRAGDRRFWGVVSAVFDEAAVYRLAGITGRSLGVEIALTGRDGSGDRADVFFGDAGVLGDNPVAVPVSVPSGHWQLAAHPTGGWEAAAGSQLLNRLVMVFGALMILAPIVATGRLIGERHRYYETLKNREVELERLSQRLGLALETSRVGVWEMQIETGALHWDDRMNELYAYPADGSVRGYAHWSARLHRDDLDRAQAEFKAAIDGLGRYESDYRLVLPDGEVRHIRAIGDVQRETGRAPRILGVNWDVTADVVRNDDLERARRLTEARNSELEAAKRRIEFNALHDSLTGLPNRRYLDEVLSEHAAAFVEGERAALLHFDLDRFKQINDTLGHAAGDAMLVHVAQVLKQLLDPQDFAARVGGDEFVVVIRRPVDDEELRARHLARLAAQIIDRLRQPVPYEGHECRFGVSIGIAEDTDAVADPRRLLVHADIALYRAKSQGRNRYQFFNDALSAEIVKNKRIADEILHGLEKGEFVAHYQPQLCADTHEIVGVEALARWNHPTQGLLAPAAFMKIAEELGVVATLDRVVLEQTLRDIDRWQEAGVVIPRASVNVSARRLHDEELIASLSGMAIRPGTLSFELVESIFLDEQDELITWNIDRIKDLGISIEIDDFGTGHASIVSLLKLRPQRLKVDRQLVMPIVRSPAQRKLVGSIIDIGRSLGVEVLAEGVETLEHARILRQLGCNALQGYAFARAMSAEDIVSFARQRQLLQAS